MVSVSARYLPRKASDPATDKCDYSSDWSSISEMSLLFIKHFCAPQNRGLGDSIFQMKYHHHQNHQCFQRGLSKTRNIRCFAYPSCYKDQSSMVSPLGKGGFHKSLSNREPEISPRIAIPGWGTDIFFRCRERIQKHNRGPSRKLTKNLRECICLLGSLEGLKEKSLWTLCS